VEYLDLPGTLLRASAICLGTAEFGSAISDEQAWELLDAFAAQGGNFVDTARVYAAWGPGGMGSSERAIGAWARSRGVRKRIILSTKGAHPELRTMHISRLSPEEIAADLMASLQDLQTDYVDLYWLHRDDPAIPVGEILDVLNEHVESGLVRSFGASNWSPERLKEAAEYARTRGRVGFCASQIAWSLASINPGTDAGAGTRTMDDGTRAYHLETSLPILAYSSQAMGFFSGTYGTDGAAPSTGKAKTVLRYYLSRDNLGRLSRARELALRRGRTPNEVALAYLLSQPFRVFPIVGCRTVEQVRASCVANDLRLSPTEMAFLDGSVRSEKVGSPR